MEASMWVPDTPPYKVPDTLPYKKVSHSYGATAEKALFFIARPGRVTEKHFHLDVS